MGNPVAAAPWSFSKIKSFKTCPKQFYHEKVLKEFPYEETPAMLYGTQFHEAAEFYIRDGVELPERFNYAKEVLDMFNNMPGDKLCEYKMGVTVNLEPCAFDAEDVWWRGIADLSIIDEEKQEAKVVDYKTGKSARYADKDQLELLALATFLHFPNIKKIKAALLFVVSNEIVKGTYTTESIAPLWKKWTQEFAQMEKAFNTGVWNPNPSGLCRAHCPVLECPHNGKN